MLTKTDQKPKSPKLRFSEFSGVWEEKRLGKVITEIKQQSNYNNEYPVLTSSRNGLMPQSEYYGENNRITERDSTGFNVIPENYITYRSRSDDGIFHFNENNLGYTGVISTYYPVFKSNLDENKFLLLILNIHWKVFFKYSVGTSQKVLSIIELKKIPCLFPKKPEQQKIATFLSSADEWIANLKAQKQSLEQYKKGMMQSLFSSHPEQSEGSIQPLRFKDDNGQDFPDWEEKKLSDIFIKKSERNRDDSIKHVLTNSAVEGIVNQGDYFDRDIANQNNLTNYFVVDVDDFIYNPRISKFAPVGPFKRNKLIKGIMSPLYTVLKPKGENLTFWEKYFETKVWHRYMYKIANYGARHDRMSIQQEDFFKMPMLSPSLPEQQRIATFLTSIDNLINSKQLQISQAKQWKKGLMQKLFV